MTFLSRAALAVLAAFLLSGCVQTGQASLQPGVVLAAVPADQPGENSGAGAIAGAVIGGVAGGQIGQGAGQVAATVAGVLLGATAGSAIEGAGQRHDGIAYTIRLSDGSVTTIVEHLDPGDPIFPAGTAVTLQTSGDTQTVLAQAR